MVERIAYQWVSYRVDVVVLVAERVVELAVGRLYDVVCIGDRGLKVLVGVCQRH